jgi:E3 ubiquitin-protein ligase SIAH1
MLAEMSTLCKFSKYGCTEVVRYIQKRQHEEACPRAPSGCPVDGCSYRGLMLSRHLLDDHADAVVSGPFCKATTVTLLKSAPFRVLVLERAAAEDAGVFLLLNGSGVPAGRSLSLVRLGPRPDGDDDGEVSSYKMEVRGSETGVLSLAGTATCVRERELEGFEARMFLFVPDANWEPTGRVSVRISIG